MNLTNEQIQAILDGAPDWQKCYCTETKQRFPYDNYRNLSDLGEILTLRQEVERLKANRETDYERWQEKYQQLKDGMTLSECYECGTRVHELSPRSRCCMCEYGRANFNEKENNQLRGQGDD